MPAAFPAAVDKIHKITVEAKEAAPASLNKGSRLAACGGTEPSAAIEQILRAVEAVKRAIQLKPEIMHTPEYGSLKVDISWWLAEHPQLCVKFAKTAIENLYSNMSTGQGRRSSDVEWRLDALEGIASLALEQRVHLSVRRRLQAEVSTLRRLVEARA
jgi:hypothetical protein